MTYDKNTPETIQTLFNGIAPSYDLANSILSFGLHKFWNRTLIKAVAKKDSLLLDLCAGTGEISLGYLKRYKNTPHVFLLDFSVAMLKVAKNKARKAKIPPSKMSFLEADATKIPLNAKSVHAITIAYGLRNIDDPKACIKEAYRVLKSGGRFGILELTKPKNRWLGSLHTLYLKKMLPLLGKMVTSNREAYSYLSTSIPAFIAPESIKEMMEVQGFAKVKKVSLMGGIATLLIGEKT